MTELWVRFAAARWRLILGIGIGTAAILVGAVVVVRMSVASDAPPRVSDEGLCTPHAGGLPAPAPAERGILARQLATARRAAERYPTVGAAEAAGFRISNGENCSGVHLIDWRLMDGTFDIAHPEMLLATGTDSSDPIVALSYYVIGRGAAPNGFAGQQDQFHRHAGMCVRDSDDLVIGQGLTRNECRQKGGSDRYIDGWMLHVWPLAAYQNPHGMFAVSSPVLDR